MSTIRKVPLRLGLVSATVGVQGAIDDAQPKFNTVCDQGHDPARVKQSLRCPTCDNTEYGTFKKAQPTDDGKYVVVDPDKLKEVVEVPSEVKDAINLTAHPAEDLRFAIPGGKVYYLAPAKGEHNTYALFVELVSSRSDEVAFCAKFALRGKPAMYQLGVHEGALTMSEIAWPTDVREAPKHDGELDTAMSEMAHKFLDTIIEPFDADEYVDVRASAVAEFMAKQKAVDAGDAEQVTTSSPDDLMAAMAAAVGDKPKPKKKAARKKAAKKAATKKAG